MTTAQMKRFTLALAAAVLTVLLPGCIEMKRPLTSPDTASVDTNLLGTWQRDDNKQTETMVIDRSAINGLPAATMHAHETDYDKVKGTTDTTDQYFTVSSVNGFNYVNLFAKGTDFSTDQECAIIRYIVSGDELTEMVGVIGKADNNITKQNGISGPDDVDGLARYLGTQSGADTAFPATGTTVIYRRIASPLPPPASVVYRPLAPLPASTPLGSPSGPAATPPAPTAAPDSTSSSSSSLTIGTFLPWMILVFIAGIFVARRFSGKR